jgi:hypothetical protein
MILHATHYHAATHEIGKRLLFYIGVDSAARGNSSTMEVSIVCVELLKSKLRIQAEVAFLGSYAVTLRYAPSVTPNFLSLTGLWPCQPAVVTLLR